MTEREGWEHECGTVQPGLSSSEVCECVVGGGGEGAQSSRGRANQTCAIVDGVGDQSVAQPNRS
jgi:hypothetical protein